MKENNKKTKCCSNIYTSICNAINAPICVLNFSGEIIFINDEFKYLTGYSHEEVKSKFLDVLFVQKRSNLNSKLQKLSDEDVYSINSVHLKHTSNIHIPVSIDIGVYFENNLKYFICTFHDLSKEIQLETELYNCSQAIEQSPVSVVITDVHGDITYVNPKFTRVTGYTYDEAIGANPRILKSGKQSAEFYTEMWSTILNGKEWRGEFHNKKKNGESYWEDALISPIIDKNGIVTNFIAVKEDITEKKLALEALHASEEKLRRKNSIMQQDLDYSKIIIDQLLPENAPVVDFLRITYRYMPLEVIGGDFFSFFKSKNEKLGIFLGDVAGHGVMAALFLTLVHFITNQISNKYWEQPLDFLHSLNNELLISTSSHFLTAAYCLFEKNQEAIVLKYAKGGHPPIIYCNSETGEIGYIKSHGRIIGIIDEVQIEEKIISCKTGDRFFLFTDGLHETVNDSNTMLELEGLLEIVKKTNESDLDKTLDKILLSINNYKGEVPFKDDIIIMGIEII